MLVQGILLDPQDPPEGACQLAALVEVAVSTLPIAGVPDTVTPLIEVAAPPPVHFQLVPSLSANAYAEPPPVHVPALPLESDTVRRVPAPYVDAEGSVDTVYNVRFTGPV